MINSENPNKSRLEAYEELAKNSLVKVQYSCGGNSTSVDEPELIPIVSNKFKPLNNITCTSAREEDVEEILKLLRENNLPIKDLSTGQRIFLVALAGEKLIGVVAVELYGEYGLLRSLAVNAEFRSLGIGKKLVAEAETWSINNGLKQLFLLTTTAAEFFPKAGWKITERSTVPESIAASTEFASVCPSTAICMSKNIE